MKEQPRRKVLIIYERHPDEDVFGWEEAKELRSIDVPAKDILKAEAVQGLQERGIDANLPFSECLEKEWQLIRKIVMDKISKLDPSRLKLYVDSCCGADEYRDMIRRNIKQGTASASDYLFNELENLGIRLQDTEGLFIDDADCKLDKLRSKLAELGVGTKVRDLLLELDECITKAREEYIAAQIDATLGDDEVGLLFIGAGHKDIERLLLERGVDCEVLFETKLSPENLLPLQDFLQKLSAISHERAPT
jgi:hypothetical protein